MSYIYVMQNEGLLGLVQIGITDDDPEVRAQELSNITGRLGRFTVARQWQLKDAAIYERRISAVLGCYRVSGEHFRLPVEDAIRRITAMLYSWGVVNEEGLTRDEAEAVREAAALRAEQDRIKAEKRAEEVRQRTIEAEVVRAQAEAAHAESARGVSPRAAHRSVRETLASYGSCHSLKAAAFRRHRQVHPVSR